MIKLLAKTNDDRPLYVLGIALKSAQRMYNTEALTLWLRDLGQKGEIVFAYDRLGIFGGQEGTRRMAAYISKCRQSPTDEPLTVVMLTDAMMNKLLRKSFIHVDIKNTPTPLECVAYLFCEETERDAARTMQSIFPDLPVDWDMFDNDGQTKRLN